MASKKRILLVDDDVDFLEINKAALVAAGYDVVMAHDSKEGLKLASAGGVDAAILDVMMTTPDEGFELARAMRKNERTARIPLIMLTSVNAVHEAKGQIFRLGDQDRDDMFLPVDKFIDKPVKADALVAVVRELTGGGK
jgi:CheY-like chemotaxis protein